jgi:transposase
MAAPLTDDERTHIVELLEQGLSCAAIAKTVGRSPGTVSNIARSIGHRFGHSNAVRAHEARSAYSAERRAEIAAEATERAQKVLASFDGEFLAHNFGGKDNTYAEHLLPAPPVEAQRAMAQTFRELMRTVIDIHRLDTKADEGVSDVDDWLRHQMGDSVQVSA